MKNQSVKEPRYPGKEIDFAELEKTVYSCVPFIPKRYADLLIDFMLFREVKYFNVSRDPSEFCECMARRDNDAEGDVIFGQVEFARSLVRNCYVGIVKDPVIPAAVYLMKDGFFECHLYIPDFGEAKVVFV